MSDRHREAKQWTADQFTVCGCGHNLGQHRTWVQPIEPGQYPCRYDDECGCQGFYPRALGDQTSA